MPNRQHTPGIRLPRVFFEDHRSRDLDTPTIIDSSSRYIWIDESDPAIPELLSDAEYYASEAMHMDPPRPGLAASARATLVALNAFDTP